MSGSIPDEYSFYLPTGGYYTNQLLNSVDDVVNKGVGATWDMILTDAKKPIVIPRKDQPFQIPQSETINLREVQLQ